MRHIQNNYQYMTHVYEARITDFKLSNLHLTKDGAAKSNSQPATNGPSSHSHQAIVKKQEAVLGNVYGTLKRSSASTEVFIYEYFEGSTNKIKAPLKFSSLMEMFQ
jgi:hypothetical protein